MGKALKHFEWAGELGYCALCCAPATSRVRIGLERLPVSFCDEHRWQARQLGVVVAVEVWEGKRPRWLPAKVVPMPAPARLVGERPAPRPAGRIYAVDPEAVAHLQQVLAERQQRAAGPVATAGRSAR